jgi:hypothetical protein
MHCGRDLLASSLSARDPGADEGNGGRGCSSVPRVGMAIGNLAVVLQLFMLSAPLKGARLAGGAAFRCVPRLKYLEHFDE